MTDLAALEAEIQDACLLWVEAGKILRQCTFGDADCGCALTALFRYRGNESTDGDDVVIFADHILGSAGRLRFTDGFDGLASFNSYTAEYELGARVAAWADQEGLL